jgi:DNA-binding response OmpR family regulator
VRIEAVLRRREGKQRIQIGGYELDVVAKRLWRGDKEIDLSARLFDLLHLLIGAHGEAVTTERIMLELWPRDREASYGALRVYITRLKKHFGDRIENIRGVGYRFVAKDHDA